MVVERVVIRHSFSGRGVGVKDLLMKRKERVWRNVFLFELLKDSPFFFKFFSVE